MNSKNAMKKEKVWGNKRVGGFTLVELIVVLVILSILSAVAVPSVLGFIDDSKAKECRSQVEALTSDIISAKMAFETNGEIDEDGKIGGNAFDVQKYINEAGDAGRCPVNDVPYEYIKDEHKIVCPKGHGESVISDSGKFTVAVVEETDKRESPDEVLPPKEDEDDKKEPETNKTVPSISLKVTPGSVDDLEQGESRELAAEVTRQGFEGKENVEYHYEWKSSDSSVSVTPSADGRTVTVTGESAGGSSTVTCTVTVTYTEDGETKTVEDSVDVPVKVTDSKPEPSVSLEVTPGSVDDLEQGKSRELKAEVTQQGLSDKEDVEYHYEWKSSDSSVTVTPSADGRTATVTGASAGGSSTVTCTVTATYTENGETKTVTDTKEIPVTVTEPQTESQLGLEVPPLTVEEGGEGKKIEAHATDGKGGVYPGNVEYHYDVTPQEGDSGEITVDENGIVRGVHPGTCHVTVTVTDTNDSTKTKSQTIEVTVEPRETEPQTESEEESIFNPNYVMIWKTDVGSKVHLVEELRNIYNELDRNFVLPQGGRWTNPEGYKDVEILEDEANPRLNFQDDKKKDTYTFAYTYPTEDGNWKTDSITVKVGYPISSIQQIDILRAGTSESVDKVKIGDSIDCSAKIDPDWTIDVKSERPLQWEILPKDVPVDIAYRNENHTEITLTINGMGAEGTQLTVRAYTTRMKDGELREFSKNVPLEYRTLERVEIPSELIVRVGETADLGVRLYANGESNPIPESGFKPGSISYKYTLTEDGYCSVQNNIVTGKVSTSGLKNQGVNLKVIVQQDGQKKGEGICCVKVVNTVEIGEEHFGAMSWKEFQANVQNTDGTYNLNKHRWESDEDLVVLCYDEKGFYIGQGNSVDFSNGKNKNNTPSVGTAESFHEFMETNDGNNKFYKVDIAGMKTINYEDLETAADVEGGYPGGTIVKVVIAPGVYEYYVAIDPKGTKTQLKDILNYKTQNKDICGWWKLKIL